MNNPPVTLRNYPTYLWKIITDKTGTQYQSLVGRTVDGGPWGVRVWRCVPNSKPELIFFLEDGNGQMYVNAVTKKLEMLVTDKNWQPHIIPIEGYIHPVDCPDSTIVNINELQVASLKQSIATTQNMATSASQSAQRAQTDANDAHNQIERLQKQVNALQAKVDSMLTPQQIADLVWSKLIDMNYLYRLGFITYPVPSPDANVRDYVNDLVQLIKKV